MSYKFKDDSHSKIVINEAYSGAASEKKRKPQTEEQ